MKSLLSALLLLWIASSGFVNCSNAKKKAKMTTKIVSEQEPLPARARSASHQPTSASANSGLEGSPSPTLSLLTTSSSMSHRGRPRQATDGPKLRIAIMSSSDLEKKSRKHKETTSESVIPIEDSKSSLDVPRESIMEPMTVKRSSRRERKTCRRRSQKSSRVIPPKAVEVRQQAQQLLAQLMALFQTILQTPMDSADSPNRCQLLKLLLEFQWLLTELRRIGVLGEGALQAVPELEEALEDMLAAQFVADATKFDWRQLAAVFDRIVQLLHPASVSSMHALHRSFQAVHRTALSFVGILSKERAKWQSKLGELQYTFDVCLQLYWKVRAREELGSQQLVTMQHQTTEQLVRLLCSLAHKLVRDFDACLHMDIPEDIIRLAESLQLMQSDEQAPETIVEGSKEEGGKIDILALMDQAKLLKVLYQLELSKDT
jgi:hypothetical protein